MGAHLINGEFQSDKYPTTPRGKVPLSVKDPTAQDLLWEYAQRRRDVDAEFSDDLEESLRLTGYEQPERRRLLPVVGVGIDGEIEVWSSHEEVGAFEPHAHAYTPTSVYKRAVNEAIEATHDLSVKAEGAASAERAAIVHWIRTSLPRECLRPGSPYRDLHPRNLADAIENGAHTKA